MIRSTLSLHNKSPGFSSAPHRRVVTGALRLKPGQPIQDRDSIRSLRPPAFPAPERADPSDRPFGGSTHKPWCTWEKGPRRLNRTLRQLLGRRLLNHLSSPWHASCRRAACVGRSWELGGFPPHPATQQSLAKKGDSGKGTERWGWGPSRLDPSRDRFAGHQPRWRAVPVPAGRCQTHNVSRRPWK